MPKYSRKAPTRSKGSSKTADIPKKVKQPILVTAQKFSRGIKKPKRSKKAYGSDSGTFGSQSDMNKIAKEQKNGLGK